MSFYLSFLGAPGCGKGTQTEKLSQHFQLPVLGIGNLIRNEIKSGSDLGKSVSATVANGNLVSDDIIITLFEGAIDTTALAQGVIVDGYPRTLSQAKSFHYTFLNQKWPIKIILLSTDYDVIKTRLLGRRICSCGQIYHVDFNPPQVKNQCDLCQSELVLRSDDTVQSIKNRYDIFISETAPILDYFGDSIITIDANQSSDQVFQSLLDHIISIKA